MDNILEAQGFAPEFMGGGCYLLSRYFPNGACVAVSTRDGAFVPTASDWLVCGYPDGAIGDTSFDCYFDSDGDATLQEAIELATAAVFDPDSYMGETCRNGRPWADCDCC